MLFYGAVVAAAAAALECLNIYGSMKTVLAIYYGHWSLDLFVCSFSLSLRPPSRRLGRLNMGIVKWH